MTMHNPDYDPDLPNLNNNNNNKNEKQQQQQQQQILSLPHDNENIIKMPLSPTASDASA